jgi:hypothetical protein
MWAFRPPSSGFESLKAFIPAPALASPLFDPPEASRTRAKRAMSLAPTPSENHAAGRKS